MTSRQYRLAIFGTALATAVLCLPFQDSYPLFDPDEGFYPATAAESMATGDPLDLRLNGEPRWNKPPLAYALMQISFALLGRSETAARLPSILEAAALVAILGLLVARVAGRRAGLFTSLVLASSLGHLLLGRAAHPEMALVLGTAVAQALFATWFVAPPGDRPARAWWTAGAAMGFGFLAKGPVALALPALMLVAGRLLLPPEGRPDWREIGRVFGKAAALAVGLAAPWFLWMGARHGGEFWRTVFGQLGHFTSGEYEHEFNNPLYFVPVLAVGFLPWTFFLPGALRHLRRRSASPQERLRLLMFLAAGTSFVFWSLSWSKLPNYALVFLPPLAVAVGIDLREGSGRTSPMVTVRSRLPCLALAFLGGVVLVSPSFLGLLSGKTENLEFEDGFVFTFETSRDDVWNEAVGMTSNLGGLTLVVVGLYGIGTKSQSRRVVAVAAAWLLLLPALLFWWREFDSRERPAKAFAARYLAAREPGDRLAVYRRRLPSMSFYSSGTVPRLRTPTEVRALVDAPGRAWLAVQRKDFEDLAGGAKGPAALEAVARRFEILDEGGGIALLREREAPASAAPAAAPPGEGPR